jgi:hypothetical protein
MWRIGYDYGSHSDSIVEFFAETLTEAVSMMEDWLLNNKENYKILN